MGGGEGGGRRKKKKKEKIEAIIIMLQGLRGKKPEICRKELLSLRESREVDLKADILKAF